MFTLAILLIITNSSIKAQESEKVVINTKMIERFNSVEVGNDFITFNGLVEELNFEDIKEVYTAYYEDNININSKTEVYLVIEQRKTVVPEFAFKKEEEEKDLLSSTE